MPIYAYRCTACGHTFEELILRADDVPEACPECGGTVERIFSGSVGLVFKGSGFYITDYVRKSSPSSSNGKGGTSSSGDNARSSTASSARKD